MALAALPSRKRFCCGELDAHYRPLHSDKSHINDILADVNDVLNPHGFDEIMKDDFAKLRQILSERLMLILGDIHPSHQ